MAKRQLLLLSSSRLHGFEYLQHAKDEIISFLNKNNVKKILFIPFAQKDYDSYLKTVRKPLEEWNFQVESIHNHADEINAIKTDQAIFIGGGNSFVLLKTLYDKNLIKSIQEVVLENGIPYIGSSAGTNVATLSIKTTNDMPIVYPPTFDALKLVPFNINPHYIETDPNTKHKGETRDQRIEEFLQYNNETVVGLREGTSLLVDGQQITLQGRFGCKIFNRNFEVPQEFSVGNDINFLLQEK